MTQEKAHVWQLVQASVYMLNDRETKNIAKENTTKVTGKQKECK